MTFLMYSTLNHILINGINRGTGCAGGRATSPGILAACPAFSKRYTPERRLDTHKVRSRPHPHPPPPPGYASHPPPPQAYLLVQGYYSGQ